MWSFSSYAEKGAASPAKPPAKKKTVATEPKTITELFHAFSHGLTPDFSDPDQMRLFEMYRVARFGDATVEIPSDYAQKILKFKNQNPDISKPAFSEVIYKKQDFLYPAVSELKSGKSMQSLWDNIQSMRVATGSLLAADKQLINPKKLSESDYAALFGKEGAAKKWDNAEPREQQVKKLFVELLKLRALKIKQNESPQFVNQAILDIANTIGFENPLTQDTMKSKETSSHQKLAALRKGIYHREDFIGDMAQFVPAELVIDGGYDKFIETLGLRKASKFPDDKTLLNSLQTIETEINEKGTKVNGEPVRVRQLSPAEEPLRSCVGGDCSSRTYFEKAMEADFIYFTETDETHHSKGHATLVLGTAQGKKVAMLDKLQNVANDDIPYFLESIRRSLAVDGYVLGVPQELGDHNGLSNYEFTRAFVAGELDAYRDSKEIVSGFKPLHPSLTGEVYSRAYNELPLRILQPISKEKQELARIRTGSRYEPVKMGHATIEKIVAGIKLLKVSPEVSDHFEYVHTTMALLKGGVVFDPEYSEVFLKWMESPISPIQLKNTILRQQLDLTMSKKDPYEDSFQLREYADKMTRPELQTFVQNLSQIERYRDFMVENFKFLGSMRAVLIENHPTLFRRALEIIRNDEELSYSDFDGKAYIMDFALQNVLGVELDNLPEHLAKTSPVERARMASSLLGLTQTTSGQKQLQQRFNLPSLSVMEIAAKLNPLEFRMHGLVPIERLLSATEFNTLQRELGYRLENLEEMDPYVAAHHLVNIYKTASPFDRIGQPWAKMVTRLLTKISEDEEKMQVAAIVLSEFHEETGASSGLRQTLLESLKQLDGKFEKEPPESSLMVSGPLTAAFFKAAPTERPLLYRMMIRFLEIQREERIILVSPIEMENRGIVERMIDLLESADSEDQKWGLRFFTDYKLTFSTSTVSWFKNRSFDGRNAKSGEMPATSALLHRRAVVLFNLLSDPSIEIAGQAAISLTRGINNIEFIYYLRKEMVAHEEDFVRVLQESDETTVALIVESLHRRDFGENYRKALEERLVHAKTDRLILEIATALGDITPEQESIYAKLLDHESSDVQAMAAEKMQQGHENRKPETLIKLAKFAHHKDPDVVAAAALALAKYLKQGGSIEPKLILPFVDRVDLTRSSAYEVANAVFLTLFSFSETLTDAAYKKAIAEDLENASEERFRKYLKTLLPVRDPEIGKVLVKRLLRAPEELHRSIFNLLKWQKDPEVLGELIMLIFHPSETTRKEAITYLWTKDQSEDRALLRKLLRETLLKAEHWRNPDISQRLTDIFDSAAISDKDINLYEELGYIIRDIPEIRRNVRKQLLAKRSLGVFYVLRPDLKEDREIIKREDLKIPSKDELTKRLDWLLDQLEKNYPVRTEDYYKTIRIGVIGRNSLHMEESSPAIQEALIEFKNLFRRRRYLDNLADDLHQRLLKDAENYEARVQARAGCPEFLQRLKN